METLHKITRLSDAVGLSVVNSSPIPAYDPAEFEHGLVTMDVRRTLIAKWERK